MEALADGILVDVTQAANEAGFRYPVAMTDTLFTELEHGRGHVGSPSRGGFGMCIVPRDQPIETDVDKAEPRRGLPVPEQPRLDVLRAKWLKQKRIFLEVDLADGEVVRGASEGVDTIKFFARKRHGHLSAKLLQPFCGFYLSNG